MTAFRLRKFSVAILLFPLLVSVCLIALNATEAHAQYYLADCKSQPAGGETQNADNVYDSNSSNYSGLTVSEYDGNRTDSDACMGGFVTFFLGIAGACIGIPLMIMVALRLLVGTGVSNASMRNQHLNQLYLDAPPQPVRWYDPTRRHILEMGSRS